MYLRLISLCFAVLLTTSCTCRAPGGLYQVGSLDALMRGGYSAQISLAELRKHGDFGLGTFEALDGEMVVSQGRVYQVKATGQVLTPPESLKTPFACVNFFKPGFSFKLENIATYEELCRIIEARLPSREIFYAVRVSGSFASLKARSVAAQKQPYPPLSDVAKSQSEFNFGPSTGELVGFWGPAYVKGINLPGFHLHYLSENKKSGGHLLACALSSGTVEIAGLTRFEAELSGLVQGQIAGAKVSEEDVKRVESGR